MFTGWEITDSGRRYFMADGPMALGWQSVGGSDLLFWRGRFSGLRLGEPGRIPLLPLPGGGLRHRPTQIDGETHYFSPGGLEVILVNALNPVPDYFEQDLVNVVDYHDVDRRCYEALVQMLDDCTAAGSNTTSTPPIAPWKSRPRFCPSAPRSTWTTTNGKKKRPGKKPWKPWPCPGTANTT